MSLKPNQGLDDPRVTKLWDRGEEDYTRKNPITLPQDIRSLLAGRPRNPDILDNIRDKSRDAKTYYPPNCTSFFIPRAKQDKILDPYLAFDVVNQLECYKHYTHEQRVSLVVDQIYSPKEPCWKLLLVLINIKEQECLRRLLDEGVTDRCLPFTFPTTPATKDEASPASTCQVPDHEHPSVKAWKPKSDELENFCKWGHVVKAPYFTRESTHRHVHLILENMDVLPIVYEHPQTGSPHDAEDRTGAYGKVDKVSFDPSHCDFSNIGVSTGPQNQQIH